MHGHTAIVTIPSGVMEGYQLMVIVPESLPMELAEDTVSYMIDNADVFFDHRTHDIGSMEYVTVGGGRIWIHHDEFNAAVILHASNNFVESFKRNLLFKRGIFSPPLVCTNCDEMVGDDGRCHFCNHELRGDE